MYSRKITKDLEPETVRQILMNRPPPLFSKQYELAVLFSAKAGCTFIVKWFFYQTNMLHTALSYSPWIHNFRGDVFYNSYEYRKDILGLLSSRVRIIKLVRNPYERAVSSYIHAARHGYENEKISAFLDRPIDQENSFSFREFVMYLRTIDLRFCNIHHRLQRHASERRMLLKPRYVVKLENSLEELKQIEQELGLRQSSIGELSKSPHHTYRSRRTEFCGDAKDLVIGKKNNPIPPAISFYDDDIMKEVAALYREDFDAYDYDASWLTSRSI